MVDLCRPLEIVATNELQYSMIDLIVFRDMPLPKGSMYLYVNDLERKIEIYVDLGVIDSGGGNFDWPPHNYFGFSYDSPYK